jgi:hypothetical protein
VGTKESGPTRTDLQIVEGHGTEGHSGNLLQKYLYRSRSVHSNKASYMIIP